jgi:riboflavin kinase / FMN adenylyltransferase
MTARVFRSPEEARGEFGPCALAIGNFDGVHLGHQALLAETKRQARAKALAAAVLTFDPHPSVVVAPERTPELICTLEQRLELLAQAGADKILVLPFTPEVARLSPRDFVWQILRDTLQTQVVVVGESFRFGHKQAGTAQTLEALGDEFGFVSQVVQPVACRGEVISSSAIRRHISFGRISRAGRLLGRCFSIEGQVVSGHGVGSKQTVPTLNLRPPRGQIIPRGVYVTETFERSKARRWESITNCGVRPTFGGDQLTIETFLLTPLKGEPPAHIELRFRHFIRAEQRFPTPDALRAQILKDVTRARTYWRRVSALNERPASIY